MKSLSLVIVDTINPTAAQKAVETTYHTIVQNYPISKVHWVSHETYPENTSLPVDWHYIKPIEQMPLDYNKIVFELLPQIVTEDFSLTVQSDGYAVNPGAWTPSFLFYDYIGAVWPWESQCVGNGGFSLRSRKLQDTILEFNIVADHLPEDFVICRQMRTQFEARDCVFAPPEIADRFSIEFNLSSPWLGHSLGFHGSGEVKNYYSRN